MASSNTVSTGEKSYFEQQRELLLTDVANSLENVLQNINKLNRSLEGVIAVGNEFGQVEGLWSQFENVMAKDPESATARESKEAATDEQA
ncbi:DASH complex subunit Dad1-domain-containing protein [Neohortaea acidophila]|uniref:DASH complex subunit DAD1 n=1 Tax=Neohortaea acidophila TaxID=245834 RepID=A0A6A6PS69_9PEZI|nr:DASH complex subunit Dad1-domain-containing protein [Neohortaea acidophila]KAF2482968.1 DASH complex subunit Dad1-domain-containing protein [Neohortaea acidophila]